MLPPFVFLPGLFETAHVWQPTIRRMGLDPARTLCLDLPGHRPGDTAEDVRRSLAEGTWIEEAAARIRDWQGGERAVSVGHSTGAMMSIPLVRRHPDLFHSMALVGGLASGRRARGFDPLGAVIRSRTLGGPVFRAAFRLWLSSPFFFRRGFLVAATRSPPKGSFPELPLMRAQLAACDLPALRAMATWVLESDVSADLDHIDLPILALIGRADPVVAPRHQIALVRRAPNAQAQLLDCGHLVFLEAPEAVARALRGWPGSLPQEEAASA